MVAEDLGARCGRDGGPGCAPGTGAAWPAEGARSAGAPVARRAARTALVAAAVAGGLVLAPRPAVAAEGAGARIEVVPSLGLSETWSDNIDLAESGTRSGFTTNITPRIRFRATGGRLTGGAAYALNARVGHEGGGETDLEHDAVADLTYAVSPRWQLSLRDDFRFSPDPTRSLVFVTPGGEVFRTFEEIVRQPGVDVLDIRAVLVREDEIRNRLSAGTAYALTPRLSVDAEAIWLLEDSLDDVFREDSETIGGRLRLDYRLTPIDDVSLSGGIDRTTFDISPDATVLRSEVGFGRRLSETVRLDLLAGYVRIDTEDDGTDGDRSEWTGRISLVAEQAEGRLFLTLAREIAAGDTSGDLSRRLVAEARASRDLGRLTTGDVRLRYLETRAVRGLGADANVFEAIGSLSYRFIRWAAVRAAYRYRRSEAPNGGSTVDENSILLGVDVAWPLRELPGLRTAQ